jgi:iron complex outermembrane receptor protein
LEGRWAKRPKNKREDIVMKNVNSIPLAAAILLAATGVSAQQRSGLMLEEVIVTARKIEENLQDVPLSITAFSAQEIESAGINNLYDLANFTPGLTFSNVQGDFLSVPVIRGMAPTAILGRENNAAFFVNGVFVSARSGLNFSQLDLERIEVVKGPQAAMYGRNSFAGAINFVTAKPTDEFQGKAELTLGDDERRLASVSVSGPLVEGKLRGRLALLDDQWSGSYNNAVQGGPDVGGYDYQTAQGSLYWTPADNFEAILTAYVSNDQVSDAATSAVPANCEDTGGRFQNFCGELPSISENDLSFIGPAVGEDRDVIRANLSLAWDVGAGTITSLTGFDKVQQSSQLDGSRGDPATRYAYQTSISVFPGAFVLDAFDARLLQFGGYGETEDLSQELRFTSNEDRRVRYSVGTYLFSTESSGTPGGVESLDPTPPFIFGNLCPCIEFGPGSGIGFAPTIFPGGPSVGDLVFSSYFAGTNVVNSTTLVEEVDSWAVFGSLEADFTDRLTGRVELRYTDEEKTVDDLTPNNTDFNNSWDFLTWRAGLDLNLNDDVMLYASISQAEKSGDFDSATVTNINNQQSLFVSLLDPEKNLAYELGVKGTYLDGRLRTDVAVFYTDWSQIVIPQLRDTDANGIQLTLPVGIDQNGGDATITGIEANVQYAFTDTLTGQLGFTVTNAEFDRAQIESFADWPSFSPNGDVAGNKILRQSETQGNASLNYRRPMRNDLEFFMRGDVLYQGKQYVGAPNQAIVPAHTYVNLRLGLDSERFTLELWGENIFEDDNPIAAYREVYFGNALPGAATGSFSTFFPIRFTVSHPRLRQVGITGRVRF